MKTTITKVAPVVLFISGIAVTQAVANKAFFDPSFATQRGHADGPALASTFRPDDPQLNRVRVADSFSRLPLSFEPSSSQFDGSDAFLARGNGYRLFLTPTEAVLSLKSVAAAQASMLRMELLGADPGTRLSGLEALPGKVNYVSGNDPAQWRLNVVSYAKIRYEQPYPGVDLVFYGNQRQLEYDFIVAPGADPQAIALRFKGAERIEIDEAGELVLEVGGQDLRFHKPLVYQETGGVRREVAGRFVLRPAENGRDAAPVVGFQIATYDATRPLIIDPVLAYATYLGGSEGESGGISFDSAGNMYASGTTDSANFPQATPVLAGGEDVFVCKFNAAGNALLWTTFLGGSGNELGGIISIDGSGNVYVGGETSSTNFPTRNAAQPAFGGVGTNPFGGPARDGFLAKLNSSGQVQFATYVGGSGDETALFQPDSAGNMYVYGHTSSQNFPTLQPLQAAYGGGQFDDFVVKYNASGTRLYGTYLGGSGNEWGVIQLLLDSSGNPILAGQTSSPNFPTTPGAYQRAYGGGGTDLNDGDMFVTKLNAAGSAMIFSTYLGGSGDEGGNIQILEASGNMILAGGTSSPNFPTQNPVQAALRGSTDMFVTKLNAAGSGLIFSTYLGGSGGESLCPTVQADSSGNLFVCGGTGSTDYPTKNAAQANFGGGDDGDTCVTKLNSAGDTILFSTYFGGSGRDGGGLHLDANGNFYLIGQTTSSDLRTLNAFQPSYGGAGMLYGIVPGIFGDVFVAKFNAGSGALTWSTYYGGRDEDAAWGISLDGAGNVYLGGNTPSTNLPTANPMQAGYGGGERDAFVAKITAAGALEFSTYYGGNGDEQPLFFRNAAGDMYLVGTTTSSNLRTVGAMQSTYGGGESDMFMARITPGGAATFSLQPVNQSFPISGGAGSVQVSGSGAWSVVNNNGWIHITSGSSGSGNGTVQYTVDANAGAARTGVVTIAGQAFSVIQDGQAAGLTLSPTSQSVPAAGGVYGVGVTAPATTGWTATPAPADDWITIVTGASGTGNGSVSYRVAQNSVSGPRTGSITIGGQTFTVNQQGGTVVFTLSPESETFSDAGGTGQITVYSSIASTAWTAQPSNSWIHITSGASGTGSGSVDYSVDANTLANPRTGFIGIGGTVFTVVQAGVATDGTADVAVITGWYPDDVKLGAGSVTNFVEVLNVGPDSAHGVSLIDTLPAGVTFVSATTDKGTFSRSGNSVTFTLGSLASFEIVQITLVVQPTIAGTFPNTVRAVSSTTDPDPVNNEASAEILVRSGLPEADLVVQGYADWDPVEMNTELTYTITAWNWGPDEATAVFLTNTLPAGVSFVSAAVTLGSVTRNGNVIIADIGSLLYDEWADLTIVVKPTAVGVIENQSRGTTSAPDPDLSNNLLTLPVVVYDPSGSADSDGDGMPDDWEITSGLDLTEPSDAWEDPDADGKTNLQEYLARTNPWVPDTELVISQITREGDDIVVTFPTQAGVQYQLERTSNIASGSWTAVGDPVDGTGEVATVTDTNVATQSRGFYRVQQL